MTLVPMSTAVGDSYTLDVDLTPRAPLPGAATRARFHVRDPRTGVAVTRFDVLHEKLFHLFVVSRDLQFSRTCIRSRVRTARSMSTWRCRILATTS